MSDLLSPVLFVTQNEVESFWCLTGFMQLLVRTDVFYVSLHNQQRAELRGRRSCLVWTQTRVPLGWILLAALNGCVQ